MTRVTISDVAMAAGVSKTAVSFAFNNPEKLGHATVERVLQVADGLGYAPHPAARALSLRRSGTIGVLIPQRLSTVFANAFLSELLQGLGELCEKHDLSVLLVPPLDGSLEGAIRAASVDGFVSLGLSSNDRALETLDRLGIPTVLVDADGSVNHPTVNVDDAGGAEAAARHLLKLGHRDIAVIGLPPTRAQVGLTPTAARRLAGYQSALEEARAPAPLLVTAGISQAAATRFMRTQPARGRPNGLDRAPVAATAARPRRIHPPRRLSASIRGRKAIGRVALARPTAQRT